MKVDGYLPTVLRLDTLDTTGTGAGAGAGAGVLPQQHYYLLEVVTVVDARHAKSKRHRRRLSNGSRKITPV